MCDETQKWESSQSILLMCRCAVHWIAFTFHESIWPCFSRVFDVFQHSHLFLGTDILWQESVVAIPFRIWRLENFTIWLKTSHSRFRRKWMLCFLNILSWDLNIIQPWCKIMKFLTNFKCQFQYNLVDV